MNTPILSILIPTMPSRKEVREKLIESLVSKIDCDQPVVSFKNDMQTYHYKSHLVEILVCEDDKLIIGQKRQLMLEMAIGQYVAFVDDDDKVSDQYVSLILSALEQNPDVVGLIGTYSYNGGPMATWEISKRFTKWSQSVKNGKTHYLRSPNHLAPIRRSIALQIGFKNIGHGEDADYSKRLVKAGLCKTEVKINTPLYWYDDRK